jgi:hypothetical protein
VLQSSKNWLYIEEIAHNLSICIKKCAYYQIRRNGGFAGTGYRDQFYWSGKEGRWASAEVCIQTPEDGSFALLYQTLGL